MAQSPDLNGRPPAESSTASITLDDQDEAMQLGPGPPGFKVSEEGVSLGGSTAAHRIILI